jgi:hypothetical protein
MAQRLVLAAGTMAVLFLATYVGATAREGILEARCLADGRTPLWSASSPADHRPDGFLPFTCR